MESWILGVIEKFGYMGILFLIALENIFPPIPSEVILTFAGYMTIKTSLTVNGVILFSTIGSVLGAIILYGIGLFLDEDRVERIIDKWGGFLRLKHKDIHNTYSWFEKYGIWTVFFCRFVPLIRSLISIPAGMTRMNFWIFLVLTTVGTLIWNTVLIKVGSIAGESWGTIVSYMDVYSNIVYVLIGLSVLIVIGLIIRRRFR